jgi:hypothetical protein
VLCGWSAGDAWAGLFGWTAIQAETPLASFWKQSLATGEGHKDSQGHPEGVRWPPKGRCNETFLWPGASPGQYDRKATRYDRKVELTPREPLSASHHTSHAQGSFQAAFASSLAEAEHLRPIPYTLPVPHGLDPAIPFPSYLGAPISPAGAFGGLRITPHMWRVIRPECIPASGTRLRM